MRDLNINEGEKKGGRMAPGVSLVVGQEAREGRIDYMSTKSTGLR